MPKKPLKLRESERARERECESARVRECERESERARERECERERERVCKGKYLESTNRFRVPTSSVLCVIMMWRTVVWRSATGVALHWAMTSAHTHSHSMPHKQTQIKHEHRQKHKLTEALKPKANNNKKNWIISSEQLGNLETFISLTNFKHLLSEQLTDRCSCT